jgi:hypothetical protein
MVEPREWVTRAVVLQEFDLVDSGKFRIAIVFTGIAAAVVGPANGADDVVDAGEGGGRGRLLLLQTRNLVLQGCQRSDDLFDGGQTTGQVLEGNCRFFPGSRAIAGDRRPAHGGSTTVAN